GPLDLGIVYNVWAANSNEQYVILNGSPAVIFPSINKQEIDLDPAFPRLLAMFTPTPNFPAGQPRIVAWPFDYFFETAAAMVNGRQRFVFQFSVANGCHACGTGYLARFAFDFGADRKLQQATLLGICRGLHAQEG